MAEFFSAIARTLQIPVWITKPGQVALAFAARGCIWDRMNGACVGSGRARWVEGHFSRARPDGWPWSVRRHRKVKSGGFSCVVDELALWADVELLRVNARLRADVHDVARDFRLRVRIPRQS